MTRAARCCINSATAGGSTSESCPGEFVAVNLDSREYIPAWALTSIGYSRTLYFERHAIPARSLLVPRPTLCRLSTKDFFSTFLHKSENFYRAFMYDVSNKNCLIKYFFYYNYTQRNIKTDIKLHIWRGRAGLTLDSFFWKRLNFIFGISIGTSLKERLTQIEFHSSRCIILANARVYILTLSLLRRVATIPCLQQFATAKNHQASAPFVHTLNTCMQLRPHVHVPALSLSFLCMYVCLDARRRYTHSHSRFYFADTS